MELCIQQYLCIYFNTNDKLSTALKHSCIECATSQSSQLQLHFLCAVLALRPLSASFLRRTTSAQETHICFETWTSQLSHFHPPAFGAGAVAPVILASTKADAAVNTPWAVMAWVMHFLMQSKLEAPSEGRMGTTGEAQMLITMEKDTIILMVL